MPSVPSQARLKLLQLLGEEVTDDPQIVWRHRVGKTFNVPGATGTRLAYRPLAQRRSRASRLRSFARSLLCCASPPTGSGKERGTDGDGEVELQAFDRVAGPTSSPQLATTEPRQPVLQQREAIEPPPPPPPIGLPAASL